MSDADDGIPSASTIREWIKSYRREEEVNQERYEVDLADSIRGRLLRWRRENGYLDDE